MRRLTTTLALATLAATILTAAPSSIGPAEAHSHDGASPTITPTVTCDDDSMTIAVQIDGVLPEQEVRLHDWTLSGGGYEQIVGPSQLEERTVPVLRTLRVWVTVDGETRYDSGDLYRGANAGACGLAALPVGVAIDVTDGTSCVEGAARYAVTVSAGQRLTYSWAADGASTIETLQLSGTETLTWDVPLGAMFRFRLYDQHDRPTYDTGELIAVADEDCQGSAEPSLAASLELVCTDGELHALASVTNDGNVPVDARATTSIDGDEGEVAMLALLAPGDVRVLDPFPVPGGATVEVRAQQVEGDWNDTLDEVEVTAPTTCAVADPDPDPEPQPDPGDEIPPPGGDGGPATPTTPGDGTTSPPPGAGSGSPFAPIRDQVTGPIVARPVVEADARGRQTLPRTGGPADRTLAPAAALLALGGALVAMSRRARRTA